MLLHLGAVQAEGAFGQGGGHLAMLADGRGSLPLFLLAAGSLLGSGRDKHVIQGVVVCQLLQGLR